MAFWHEPFAVARSGEHWLSNARWFRKPAWYSGNAYTRYKLSSQFIPPLQGGFPSVGVLRLGHIGLNYREGIIYSSVVT